MQWSLGSSGQEGHAHRRASQLHVPGCLESSQAHSHFSAPQTAWTLCSDLWWRERTCCLFWQKEERNKHLSTHPLYQSGCWIFLIYFFSFPTPNCNCSTLMRSNGEVPSSCLKGMQLVGGFYLLPRTSTLAEGPARIAA